jgi:hypothetical protein
MNMHPRIFMRFTGTTRQAKQLVLDWAELHQAELLADWDLCQANQHPLPIDPLK